MPAMPTADPGGMPAGLSAAMGGGQGNADQARAALEETIGKLRDLDGQIQAIVGSMPTMAQEAQQMRAMLKRMIMKAAQANPGQPVSADALPTGA